MTTVLLALGVFLASAFESAAQAPVAMFKSSIELVRLNAVVRDRNGRFVEDLTSEDFEILDGGIRKRITDFRREDAGLSLALLFDVSGSMEAGLKQAREAATLVLESLDERDEAAVFTFDTELEEVAAFRRGMKQLPERLSSLKPFGATSLHDAVARTAQRVVSRDVLRRSVVVFTDGQDTWSRLTPSDVSGIASSIDVPVYIVGVVPAIDNPASDVALASAGHSVFSGPLYNLAYWTGGRTFVVSSGAERGAMARDLVEELRRHYLIAFESSVMEGWHPLAIRMRDRDLTVRARSGYFAGQSRPISR